MMNADHTNLLELEEGIQKVRDHAAWQLKHSTNSPCIEESHQVIRRLHAHHRGMRAQNSGGLVRRY